MLFKRTMDSLNDQQRHKVAVTSGTRFGEEISTAIFGNLNILCGQQATEETSANQVVQPYLQAKVVEEMRQRSQQSSQEQEMIDTTVRTRASKKKQLTVQVEPALFDEEKFKSDRDYIKKMLSQGLKSVKELDNSQLSKQVIFGTTKGSIG